MLNSMQNFLEDLFSSNMNKSIKLSNRLEIQTHFSRIHINDKFNVFTQQRYSVLQFSLI